jgi:hypothetical protein
MTVRMLLRKCSSNVESTTAFGGTMPFQRKVWPRVVKQLWAGRYVPIKFLRVYAAFSAESKS